MARFTSQPPFPPNLQSPAAKRHSRLLLHKLVYFSAIENGLYALLQRGSEKTSTTNLLLLKVLVLG